MKDGKVSNHRTQFSKEEVSFNNFDFRNLEVYSD